MNFREIEQIKSNCRKNFFINNANEIAKINVDSSGGGTNGNLTFPTSGTERLRITSDGSVGIGTNNPSAKLDIQGSDAELRFYRDARDRFGGLRTYWI